MAEAQAARAWITRPGERAQLTPEGPTAAVLETRRRLPLRVRSGEGSGPLARLHPGTAVVLGSETYEVVGLERERGRAVYRLDPWRRDLVIRDRVVYGPRLVEAAVAESRRAVGLRLAGPLRPLLEMIVALLPGPERAALVNGLVLDPMRGTLLVGLLQVVVCGILWPVGFITFYREHLDSLAGQARREQRDVTDRDRTAADTYAAMAPILYLTSYASLGLLYGFSTGAARLLHSRVSGAPLGDPVVSLALGTIRLARSRSRERRRLSQLGPPRPDRVLEDGDDLLVLSAREKPEWTGSATIQVGERFLRLRDVSDRKDGEWTAICYRLTPVPTGAVFRGLVHYAPDAAADAATADAKDAPAEVPRQPARAAPSGSAPAATHAGSGPRARWRVDDGEEARLTPEGPADAIIESLGSLPLRARSQAIGVHHRPEFPGTCVVVGGERYEVVGERALDTGFAYMLERWRIEHVLRDVVEYGPRLVRAAQGEREEAVSSERRARYSWLSMFVLGLLPEERQVRACDRHGIAPENATLAGAGLETSLALLVLMSLPHLARFALAIPFALLFVVPALLRTIGSLAWGDVAGSPVVGWLVRAGEVLPARVDATVIPLTRQAFWARLGLPDRLERVGPTQALVRGLLPHLSWGGSRLGRAAGARAAVQVAGEYWNVTPLVPLIEKGRLTYSYELWLAPGRETRADLPEAALPDARTYASEVLEQVSRQWDAVFAFAPWLPTLLPGAVQDRAYRGRGGAERGRRWTFVTALIAVAVSFWFFLGQGPFNFVTGLVLLVDGAQRLWRLWTAGCAPSVFGLALAPLLRAEREAYHAHRDAERETLLALGGER